ncbi:MAG: hypothetical protein M2R45_04412 [Verrucomicrobia subdivision 3 bacterium]|nr:hypothetical protein [Limisphaerales bacterium]
MRLVVPIPAAAFFGQGNAPIVERVGLHVAVGKEHVRPPVVAHADKGTLVAAFWA